METKKIKIEIKNRFTGDIIFSYEAENNTIKKTVEEAVRQGASLIGASLIGASLNGASLNGALLNGASLNGASLNGASLNGASLNGALLNGASLDGASLNGASLNRASLNRASLDGASLNRASLNRASLNRASLIGAKKIPFIPLACPSEGAFIGWKKVNDKLVKLLIPEDARRSSATTTKCRCDKALVLAITSLDEVENYDMVVNTSRYPTEYKVGEIVTPDSFDENRFNECTHGIHFFINKQEAIEYE